MQEHSCSCCDQEARLHGQDQSTQILRQSEHRLRRINQTLAFGLVSVILVMALLIAVLLGGRTLFLDNPTAPTGEDLLVSEKQEQPLQHPSAFLTAPRYSATQGPLLEWEPRFGIAYCQGFSYSGGNLTVLRDGHYNMALQITLINTQGTCEKVQLNATVSRLTNRYPIFKPLLVTYDTMCCTEGCKKSLFTSGVFSLEAGTILQVKANHPSAFNRLQNQNDAFFSLHLLS